MAHRAATETAGGHHHPAQRHRRRAQPDQAGPAASLESPLCSATPGMSRWATVRPKGCGTATTPPGWPVSPTGWPCCSTRTIPGLQYANLAVRGKQIRHVLDEQLPVAVAMGADLITVCIGMNDVTRPGPGFDDALSQLDELYGRLAGSGATVVTTTFPDLARILPIGRVLRHAGGPDQRADPQCRRPARIPARRPLSRTVDDAAGHLESRPGARFDQGAHAVRGGRRRGARVAGQQSRLGAARSRGARHPRLRSRTYSQVLWTQQHADAVAVADTFAAGPPVTAGRRDDRCCSS